jgi:hypothetical protein
MIVVGKCTSTTACGKTPGLYQGAPSGAPPKDENYAGFSRGFDPVLAADG